MSKHGEVEYPFATLPAYVRYGIIKHEANSHPTDALIVPICGLTQLVEGLPIEKECSQLAILALFERYKDLTELSQEEALPLFIRGYAAQAKITPEEAPYKACPALSVSIMHNLFVTVSKMQRAPIPHTEEGVAALAKKEDWPSRKRGARD